MARLTYEEILPNLRYVADKLEDAGLEYAAYNKGYQFNAKDREGVWHCFYPTTGKVVVHKSNERDIRDTKSFDGKTIDGFIKGLQHENLTKIIFKEEK